MESLWAIIIENKVVLLPIAGSLGLWFLSEVLGEMKWIKSNGVLSLIVNTGIKAFKALATKKK